MRAIFGFLTGKKTYLVAFAGAIYAAGLQTGLWPQNSCIEILLASAGAASLRHGISTQTSTKDKTP